MRDNQNTKYVTGGMALTFFFGTQRGLGYGVTCHDVILCGHMLLLSLYLKIYENQDNQGMYAIALAQVAGHLAGAAARVSLCPGIVGEGESMAQEFYCNAPSNFFSPLF